MRITLGPVCTCSCPSCRSAAGCHEGLHIHIQLRVSTCLQFDTLPLRMASIFDLEPGDLIFYSGVGCDV
jgi:hypothetical protein